MTEENGNRISLKEFIELHRTAHEKEHVKDQAVFDLRWLEHHRSHEKDTTAMEVRMKEHQEAHNQEHAMRAEYELANEKKLDLRLLGMTGMKEQLAQQAGTFMRTETAEAKVSSVMGRVDTMLERVIALEKANAASAGRGGGSTLAVDWLFRGVAVVGGLVALYLALSGGR